MTTTTLHLHSRLQVGEVDPRIFGGFLEHIGRAVYEGIYQPDSRHADNDGCRVDVLTALRDLRMTAMRYPGGNFASGYHWRDGAGPKPERPSVRELAWQSIEPNQFGTDEYIRLCRKMDWTPMLTVNLGTGTPEEARNWVEYCNSPAGTRYSDLRVAGGSPDPYGVKLWCLGNEMDGEWQLGHVPAAEYAIRAQQAAKMMKDTDKSIELVACGSCGVSMGTYMEWDRQVLEYLGDAADYVSLHRYVGNRDDDTPDYLAVTNSIDRQIEEMDAACRFVQARRKSKTRAYLCFDEWNVWYKSMQMDGAGQFAPHLLEEVYNLEDALVVAGFLHSFVRHADVVKIANLAQIVNVIAPILTRGDEMLVQSIFHPFAMFSARRGGVSLSVSVDGPSYESKSHGTVAYADASAILDDQRLNVFVTNRDPVATMELIVKPADLRVEAVESAEVLTGPDAKAANSYEKPDVIVAKAFDGALIKDGAVSCELPPLSLLAMTLTVA
ncbi:MAG: alpha-L-arabinofuranosidase C-terminal domain-containing protein [Capsulimonadaceae bacterium]|nr:alpha-L-arabinofuranosidase C-terminal domain-containing protein [Capsulimonadaceae bacterium]